MPKLFAQVIVLLLVFVKHNKCDQQVDHASSSKNKLPLKAYAELDYDSFKFQTAISSNLNNRNKRHTHTSFLESPILDTNRLVFTAFNREFEIYLKRETKLLANNFDVEVRYSSSNKPTEHLKDFLTSNYYSGYVNGESRSHVTCYFETNINYNTTTNMLSNTTLNQPLIYAQIHIQNAENENSTVYYIEPLINLKNEPKENTDLNQFKYLIYKIDDIDSNVFSNNAFNHTVCKPKYADNYNLKQTSPNIDYQTYLSELAKKKIRQKRQGKQNNKSPLENTNNIKEMKNRCSLALVADHRFYKEIGNQDVKLTTAYLMNVIASINTIFTRTKWIYDDGNDDNKLAENYGFYIEKIIVHTEPNPSNDHYNSLNISPDSDKVLELFGEENWSQYCLAHLFTFTSFENSVLGLAYVSSPNQNLRGGICSITTNYKKFNGLSVNTGLSSYKSTSQRQGRLLQREAELVTAHEFGHNWGSEHDPLKPECTPDSSNGGYYLMYAYSNQGSEKNNYHFSPCSINSISLVLKEKSNCFKAESLSYCGNDRIEGDEECDAGLNGRQGLDKCCDYNCKLKKGAVCSDANDYCCYQCKIAPRGTRCYSSPNYIECFEDHSYCDGISKNCPSQKPKIKDTPCNSHDSGKCDSTGHCLSLCQQQDISFLPCKCANSQNQKCMICCRNVISNITKQECLPLHETFPAYFRSPKYLTNGRPCVEGVCENEKCMQRVKDYVSRFWKVINTVTVSGFVDFMKRNIVGSIIVFSLLLWVPFSCCIHFCIDKRNRANHKKFITEKINSRIYELDQVDQSTF